MPINRRKLERMLKGSARRTTRVRRTEPRINLEPTLAREVGAVIYIGLGILFYLVIAGKAGWVGQSVNHYLRLLFGIGVYGVPLILIGLGLVLFISHQVRLNATRFLGLTLLLFGGLGLVHLRTPLEGMMENVQTFGGYTGFLSSVLLRIFISDTAATVILIAMLLVGVIMTFDFSFKTAFSWFLPGRKMEGARTSLALNKNTRALKEPQDEELNIVKPLLGKNQDEKASKKVKDPPKPLKSIDPLTINKPDSIPKNDKPIPEEDYSQWEFPPLDLLSSASSQVYVSDAVLKANAEKIREKLAQFSIEVMMKDVNIGPTVVQYTLQPHEGIKLNKITALKDDLALALAAKSIRMEAPIPGKSLVGIEVPNDKRMIVHLREMIESDEFLSLNSKLRLPIGRDVSGTPVIDDLTSMPHLLIAGATGSGKSVAMNTFLIALLYQNSPQDLRLIMIDPKRVELTSYNGIPHLLTPVITEAEKAHSALKWAVGEMNRRYKDFAAKGYRNIEEYNQAEPKSLHKIVIVVDELADLMMQSSRKETEALICRIAQMARAVGMHLVVATQRPSVDVITGLIKANIPTRIAFTVTSGVDSRTIIDTVGAEDLLGMGDMLYLPGNMSRSIRVQGVYIGSKEIEKVTNRVKLTIEPYYISEITEQASNPLGNGFVGIGDEGMNEDKLCQDAIVVIKETGKASASLLQRRLSVGYARAARILDILEEQGMIGPVDGAKAREIYIK